MSSLLRIAEDDAIAAAVSEQGCEPNRASIEAGATERMGFVDDEGRILINAAIAAYEALKVGNIGICGSIGAARPQLVRLRALAAPPPESV